MSDGPIDYSRLTRQELVDINLCGQQRRVSPIHPRAVAWDLDSSVRRTTHRRHLIPSILAGEKTWTDYSMLCADDQPIEGAVRLMRLLAYSHLNIAVSGCSDQALDLTVDWAKRHQVPLDRFELKPADSQFGNLQEIAEFKVDRLRQLEADGIVVVLFVEDHAETAAYVREHTSIPVLGVADPFGVPFVSAGVGSV